MNVAWVDFCRAYDSIPFRSILKMLELISVATNARELFLKMNIMEIWITVLFTYAKELGN